MDTQMLIRIVVGVLMLVVVGVFALKRVLFLTNLIRSGAKTSVENNRKDDLGKRITTQFEEVFGQTRLLKWSIPGLAHFFTMWGFFILGSVYVEAFGLLVIRDFAIPFVGHWDALGFLQDFFAVAVLLGITTFAIIRIVREPKKHGRDSRFYGSHTGGAWLILFMIFNVIWTYALVRGAAVNTGTLPYGNGAFFSQLMGWIMHPLGHTANEWIETIALLGHIAIMLIFLLIVLHSKHLHIGLAPVNVTFKRMPNGLGPLLPVEYNGKPIDFEDPSEDDILGRGKIEDFTWKGYLDMTTCTECGRCQSQCPAWNTGKPLSPKLVIMNLRDHLFAKAPYILGDKETPLENTPEGGLGEDLGDEKHDEEHHVPESGFERIMGSGPAQATRPLVGTLEQGGVIDPDVLWSCTTCGACVEQCPVDIEHIDHIVDMRRYQVMMESEFPGELGVLFKNLENKGNPWGQNSKDRTNWIDEVEFDVPVYGKDVESFEGLRVPVLGGLRRGVRGPGQEDHQGRRRTAGDRGREVSGARRGRDVQRRLRPPLRQRIPVPAARRPERGDAQRTLRGRRAGGSQGRGHLPALLQYPGPRVPAARRQLHGSAPHPAVEPAGPRQEAGAGQERGRRIEVAKTSPTTTPATWVGTTRSTAPHAS